MISELMRKLGAGAAAVILAAFAGGIMFIALAYALFALLERFIGPAGAGAITAVVFAVVTAGLAFMVPKVAPKKTEVVEARPKLDPNTLRLGTEMGVALLGIVGDLAFNHRQKREARVYRSRELYDAPPPPSRDERKAAKRARELARAHRKEQRALKAKHRAERKLRAERLKNVTHKFIP